MNSTLHNSTICKNRVIYFFIGGAAGIALMMCFELARHSNATKIACQAHSEIQIGMKRREIENTLAFYQLPYIINREAGRDYYTVTTNIYGWVFNVWVYVVSQETDSVIDVDDSNGGSRHAPDG